MMPEPLNASVPHPVLSEAALQGAIKILYSKKANIMIRKFLIPLLLSCCLLTVGCNPLIVGTGAGIGVYSYMNGRLTRSYQATFDQTNQACIAALNSLKISIIEKSSDGIHTTITAKRTDGTPVTVQTVMLERRITEVSVRSGIVGVWDKKVSKRIHARIAQKL